VTIATDSPAQARPSVSPGVVLAVVILFWGFGPPVSKLITAPAVVSVFYRFWISVPILYALAAARGHRLRWSTARQAALPGAAFGINLVFVFLALQSTAIAVLSVVVTLQPGFILMVAGPFLGERPRAWHVMWTLVGIGATSVVILGAGSDVEASAAGVAYAVTAMMTFTAYFVLTKRARSTDGDLDPVEWMAGISLFAALAVTPWTLAVSDLDDYRAVDGIDWLWLAFIIVVTGIAGHVLMAWTHRYVDASRSSLYLLSMNIVAIGAAWVIHDEPLTPVQMVGGVVVFVAVAAVISRPPERSGQTASALDARGSRDQELVDPPRSLAQSLRSAPTGTRDSE
jgi:drug/metabolite transporter (DMT)-like permease